MEAASSDRFPQLDKYELLEEIGHGGMATVYRAKDIRLGREVAVKIIHKHLRENAEVRRRFVAEARAVAKLRHPGIVDVYDVSDDDDPERYLVVELIRGPSLRQLLKETPVFPAEIAAILVAFLCDAIAHAHNEAVIHRDIKPENVLVEYPEPGFLEDRASVSLDGDSQSPSAEESRRRRVRFKLTDFGIAKVLDAQGVTSTGQILGSPAHMAPEQIEGGEVGPATDVFGLGVLFYECLVGHLPFEGKNPAQVLRRALDGLYEPADRERPAVGGAWARIVDHALQTDPKARPETALALRGLIDAELQSLGIEDPKGELMHYFNDPEKYQRELADRLVPRLLERGEQRRRDRRAHLAAADFNRALALRPDDLTILKRVSSLHNRAQWRRRLTRVAVMLGMSSTLGAAAYGITRLVTTPPPEGSPAPTAPPPAIASLAKDPDGRPPTVVETNGDAVLPSSAMPPSTVPAPDTTRSEAPSPTPKGPASTVRVPPLPTGEPAASDEPVLVTVHRRPMGAQVFIDGVPKDVLGGISLPPGSHLFEAKMADDSCAPASRTFTVRPAEPDARPPTVILNLKCKPAKFVLQGGPSGASVACRGVVAQRGQTMTIPMPRTATATEECLFSAPGQPSIRQSVQLRAGKTTAIAWPAPSP